MKAAASPLAERLSPAPVPVIGPPRLLRRATVQAVLAIQAAVSRRLAAATLAVLVRRHGTTAPDPEPRALPTTSRTQARLVAIPSVGRPTKVRLLALRAAGATTKALKPQAVLVPAVPTLTRNP